LHGALRFAGDAQAEKFAWGSQGVEANPRIIQDEHSCGEWRSKGTNLCN